MAEEIRLSWDDIFLEGDLSYLPSGDVESETGFVSAVIISLFTDRRAKIDDELPDPNNKDRRGWWGDLASPDVEGDQIGSKLWLLERSKTTPDVLYKAKKYAEECLQWMIEDGHASKVEVETERQSTPGNDRLAIEIKIHLTQEVIVVVTLSKAGEAIIARLNYLTMGGNVLTIGGLESPMVF